MLADVQADVQPMHCTGRPAALLIALLRDGTYACARPRLQAALDKLPGELKAQQANSAVVERRLQCEKGSWVLDGHAARVVLPREFAQVGAAAAAAASTTHLNLCLPANTRPLRWSHWRLIGSPPCCAHIGACPAALLVLR